MYRILLSIEREPLDLDKKEDKNNVRSNPHKYLLYKPTIAQLLMYVSAAFKVRFITSNL